MGKQLWIGKGSTSSMKVKSVKEEAVFEYTWTANLEGAGKAGGLNVKVIFTATKKSRLKGAGFLKGQGVFFTKQGEMVLLESVGYGKPFGGKGNSVEIWAFRTTAKGLEWLNETVASVEIEGDDQWQQFNIAVNELSKCGSI